MAILDSFAEISQKFIVQIFGQGLASSAPKQIRLSIDTENDYATLIV